ncbi:MAG: type II toxin-antitoxin system RelE family toxin [Candidatus Woesearchaeota archaeon]
MRSFGIEEQLVKDLSKLKKKANKRYLIIKAKIEEILTVHSVEHYKNLKKPLQDYKRVHIDSSFVLIFSYNAKDDSVRFVKLEHHDTVYR